MKTIKTMFTIEELNLMIERLSDNNEGMMTELQSRLLKYLFNRRQGLDKEFNE